MEPNQIACPHCGTKPLIFSEATVITPQQSMYKIASCANAECGKVLCFQFIGQVQQAVTDPFNPGKMVDLQKLKV